MESEGWMEGDDHQITVLLQRIRGGDRQAESELLPIVYGQLHRVAERQFKLERAGHTLQPTALISELYLRIFRDPSIDWQSRAHLYAVAAQTIRRILIDHARSANAQRRPRPGQRVELEDVFAGAADRPDEVLLVDELLTRLAALDPRQARTAELRIFAGLSVEETARVLGVSERTAKRDWAIARAWLSAELNAPVAGS
jgi:RNA polymerase sigma-70 factor (ECF subfamily)